MGNVTADSPSDPVFEDTNGVFVSPTSLYIYKAESAFSWDLWIKQHKCTIILQRVVGAVTTDICTIKCPDPSVTGIVPIAFDFVDVHGEDSGTNITYQLSLTLNVAGTRTVSETSQMFVTEI